MKKFLRCISLALILISCVLSMMSVPGTLAYIVEDAGKVVNSFKPSYDPVTETVFTSITAHKTVENVGKKSIGPEGFTFILENTQTFESISKVSDDKGLAVFPLTFTNADLGKTYTYQLYELKEDRGGVTYSDQVYTIKISIYYKGDDLTADVMLNDFPTTIASFRNVYNSKEDPTLPDTGDHAQPLLYAGMMLTGGVGCVLLRPSRKRK